MTVLDLEGYDKKIITGDNDDHIQQERNMLSTERSTRYTGKFGYKIIKDSVQGKTEPELVYNKEKKHTHTQDSTIQITSYLSHISQYINCTPNK